MVESRKYNFSDKFVTNNFPISSNKSITFNYDIADISIARTAGIINGSYSSNSSSPNLTYIDDNIKYTCNADKIYFVQNTHMIGGINIDGEIIIHHTVSSSQGSHYNDLYTVFPLHQSDVSERNTLDVILSTSKNNLTLNLNELIKDDLCIEYLSPSSQPPAIVILFTTPIEVNYIPTLYFDARTLITFYNSKYHLVKATKKASEGFTCLSDYNFSLKEGFVEGLEERDVNNMLSNMECEWIPYDMSGNQDVVKTYLVDSMFLSDKTTNDAMVMMKYFIFFVLFIFLIYIFVPFFYIFFAYRAIKQDGKYHTKEDVLISVGGMEIFFNSLLMFLAVFFLTLSQIYTKSNLVRVYTIVGFFLLVFWMISYLLVEIQKYTTPLLSAVLPKGESFGISDVPPFGKRLGAIFNIFTNLMNNLAKDTSGSAERLL